MLDVSLFIIFCCATTIPTPTAESRNNMSDLLGDTRHNSAAATDNKSVHIRQQQKNGVKVLRLDMLDKCFDRRLLRWLRISENTYQRSNSKKLLDPKQCNLHSLYISQTSKQNHLVRIWLVYELVGIGVYAKINYTCRGRDILHSMRGINTTPSKYPYHTSNLDVPKLHPR